MNYNHNVSLSTDNTADVLIGLLHHKDIHLYNKIYLTLEISIIHHQKMKKDERLKKRNRKNVNSIWNSVQTPLLGNFADMVFYDIQSWIQRYKDSLLPTVHFILHVIGAFLNNLFHLKTFNGGDHFKN